MNEKNILFIGNSYTFYNDMPTAIFERMASEAGLCLKVTSITKGGESLVGHATEGHDSHSRIVEVFEKEKFDYVILQDQSDTPAINREKYFAGVEYFASKAKENGAEVVIYGTWPKKEGHKNLSKFGITKSEMAKMLDESFVEASKRFGARLACVGGSFAEIENDESLPDPYNSDLSHPSYVGSYAAAFCILKKIFSVSADDFAFCGELSTEVAEAVKRIVEKTVSD